MNQTIPLHMGDPLIIGFWRTSVDSDRFETRTIQDAIYCLIYQFIMPSNVREFLEIDRSLRILNVGYFIILSLSTFQCFELNSMILILQENSQNTRSLKEQSTSSRERIEILPNEVDRLNAESNTSPSLELMHATDSNVSDKSKVAECDMGKEEVLVCGFVHEFLDHDTVAIHRAPEEIYGLICKYYLLMKQWEKEEEERLRREREREVDKRIQEQIRLAIASFQEEFGAELDEELNNMEQFQFEYDTEEYQVLEYCTD